MDSMDQQELEQSLENVQSMAETDIHEDFSDLQQQTVQPTSDTHIHLPDLSVSISVEAGTSIMAISDITKLTVGDLITLDKSEDEPFNISVQNKLFARGVIVRHDKKYAIKITEMVNN